MRKSITRRWLLNGVGIIIVVLFALVVVGTLLLRQVYYQGVSNALYEYAETTAVVFEDYLSDSSYEWTTASREFLKNFRDKAQVEVQVLDDQGRVQMTTTGFSPGSRLIEDWNIARESEDGYGLWNGPYTTGERVMSLVTVVRQDGTLAGGLRYVVSLRLVNRQILLGGGTMLLLAVLVMFFVLLSSSYFVSSIINPVKEIGRGARTIAAGNYRYRIPKRHNDEIGELCDTINYMAGEIGKTEELKNDFISSISHELRTPLTAIKGWSETLTKVGGKNENLTKKGLQVIADETDRLTALVEELLDFSRLQGGRLAVNAAWFDLTSELEETVLLYRPRAARQRIRLTFVETADLPPMLGDKDRIRQVFVNLVDNAIKYASAGDSIRVEAARMEQTVQVVVSDTGPGISPEDLLHVKEKFYRADHRIPGSGIGLALADEVIRLHGGTLTIESTQGVGTTVVVTLPLPSEDGKGMTDHGETEKHL